MNEEDDKSDDVITILIMQAPSNHKFLSGADDGEVGHTHLMAEVTTTHALAATAAAP